MTETASLVIKVDSSGARKATDDLDRLTKKGEMTEGVAARMNRGFGALGKTLASLGAGVAVGKFLGGIISNTIEAEQVQAQLAARLKSTGSAAGLAMGELNAMAKGLQQTSVYGDEAIGSAQALLLTFTKIGRETFPRAIETVLDMSTALGTDLKSSAIQLGKALNDPVLGVSALAEAGVQFTLKQKEVIKSLVETGRTADAQKIILDELASQMGGSAAAAADTLGGRISQLKEAFSDLLTGESGGEGVRGAKSAIEDLIATMRDPGVQQGFADMAGGLFSLVTAAGQAISWIAQLDAKIADSYARQNGLKPGERKLGMGDFVKAEWRGLGALFSGDFKEARKQGKRSLAALRGEKELDFTDVRGGVRQGLNAPDRIAAAFNAAFNLNAQTPDPAKPEKDKTGGGGSSKAKKAVRDLVPDADDLKRAVEETIRAREAFDGLAATLSGPLAEAEFRHIQAMEQIAELGKKGEASTEQIANAKALEAKRYAEETEAIERQLNPARELIQEKERELELLHLSGPARQTAIDLMWLEGKATQEQRDALRALNEEYENTQKQIALMDDFRSSATNALVDFVTGAKSAKDALKDFFNEMAANVTRAIAENWMAKLFGQPGSNGGGTQGGGILASIFGALFGGGGKGFATGGYTGPGGVNEFAGAVHKGEVVWSQSDISRAGGVGRVEAMRRGGGTGQLTQNFIVQGNPDRRTREQMARESGRAAAKGMRRTGR